MDIIKSFYLYPFKSEVFSSMEKFMNVLIVDDEPDLVETLTLMLKNHGFRVTSASNGIEGLEKAKTELPDIIILDLMMPEMDGFEMCKQLKSNEETSGIPIIILTAKSDTESRFKTFKYKADYYIVKPFHLPNLVSKINELLFPK